MACEHMREYHSEGHFLSPYITKTTWICLFDGCYKLKKNMGREELIAYGEKMQPAHRIMIHCQTLEIFCCFCRKEIYDDAQQEQNLSKSQKKYKNINPLSYRLLLMPPNQSQSIIYAGNSEYPPSFQKQKKGLCGLKVNGLNSYFNSVLHLIAYVPTISQIFKVINVEKIDNDFVGNLIEVINTIWSGQYRIFGVDQLYKKMKQAQNCFYSYTAQTPQLVLYFFIRKLLDEFNFQELQCKSKAITTEPYEEWMIKNTKSYNLVKEVFGGQCILQNVCSNCGHTMSTINKFECLKVSYEGSSEGTFKGMLYKLIQQALNWRNSHQLSIQKLQQGGFHCQKCDKMLKQFYSYVNLPNNLILEFGQDIYGLNVELPDEIDLTKFTQETFKKKQNSQIAIFEYVGCISRQNKRFMTHVKNINNKKQYLFCDQNIQQHQRPKNHIKLAVYKRKINMKNQPLLKNIRSCLEVNLNPIVPLPDFWSIFLKEHNQIPPLMNPYICSHGYLKPNIELSKMEKGPEKIPVEIYEYLLETFGGRKIKMTKEDDFCQQCIQKQNIIAEIKASEKQMAAFADKLSHKKDWVYINRNWLQKWKNFVYSQNKKGYKIFGNPRPGSIPNKIKNEEQVNTTHKKISPEVWYFLQKFYGGGPREPNKNYHPNVVVTASVNLRFNSLRQNFIQIYGKQVLQDDKFEGNSKIEELEEEQIEESL